jgi:hypothetical protein
MIAMWSAECSRSTRRAIVVRRAFCTVELTHPAWGSCRSSLWIVPELWKTPRARFPQARCTRTERARTRSTGVLTSNLTKNRKTLKMAQPTG